MVLETWRKLQITGPFKVDDPRRAILGGLVWEWAGGLNKIAFAQEEYLGQFSLEGLSFGYIEWGAGNFSQYCWLAGVRNPKSGIRMPKGNPK